MAIRKKLNRPPVWSGTFELWSRKWVNENFWRVNHIHGSKEDSLQECALVFARCLKYYQGKVDNHAWFMALYKRAVANEWHSYSVKDSRSREMVGGSIDDNEQNDPRLNAHAEDMGSLNWGNMLSYIGGHGLDLLDALACIAMAPADLLALLAKSADRQELASLLETDDEFIISAGAAFAHLRASEGISAADDVISDLCSILGL